MGKKEHRSKTLLTNAFFELLNEHPGKTISVRELCEKANYNRSTFYAHFNEMKDVPYFYYKTNWYYDYMEPFQSMLQEGKSIKEIFQLQVKRYFQYWSSQKEIYRNLKSIGMDCIMEKLNQDITTVIFEKLHPTPESYINSIQGKCMIRALANFSLVVYDVWVYSSVQMDVDEMAMSFMKIIEGDLGFII